MAICDSSGAGAPSSGDGAPGEGRSRWESRGAHFQSVLFEQEQPDVEALEEPDFFGDLNLDQVLDSLTADREQYELRPFFYRPLHDASGVRYRHEVFRDLERDDVREPIERFAAEMTRMREHRAQVEKLHHHLQKQSWLLDAVDSYCGAVESLAAELADLDLRARALEGLRRHLTEYSSSTGFRSLAAETRSLREALGSVEYAVHVNGGRVTVEKPEGQPDYSVEVDETFAKFKQGAARSYLVKLSDFPDMNHVEARIVELVARLYPDVFARLADYCERNGDYLDGTIARFDREVQFYLGYLQLIGRLRAAGIPFCYPHVSASSKEIEAVETFDLALANKLVPAGGTIVCNDLHLAEPERVFVVTGPNNGGKTTFARAFGQLHHLASLGLLVPGSRARLFLPDRVFTHFEQEEDIETLRGKFEDELVRVHEILEQASSRSVIVMNESFNATTLDDARQVGGAVLRRMVELGALAVYVTFVDELASLSEATVSMVSQIVPENPAERTFKVIRMPANGLAYAWAIAEKYGLTYDRLMETIPW